MTKKKVLLLGFTGRIGPSFLEEYEKNYKNKYNVFLGVHKKRKIKNYKTRKVDLSDFASLKKAMKGINVVVNFSAESDPKAPFKDIVQPNLIGSYNVFQAALESKCERVVFASSVHAIKGYPENYNVKNTDYPKPANFYGASKVFGESLCYVFSRNHNLSCLAIRIGAYVSNDKRKTVCLTRKNFDYVISQRDLAQLIYRCVVAGKKVKFGILAGSSDNKKNYMDLDFTKKLVGYRPENTAKEMCIRGLNKKRSQNPQMKKQK